MCGRRRGGMADDRVAWRGMARLALGIGADGVALRSSLPSGAVRKPSCAAATFA